MNSDLQKLMDNEELMIGLVECQTPAELEKLLKEIKKRQQVFIHLDKHLEWLIVQDHLEVI